MQSRRWSSTGRYAEACPRPGKKDDEVITWQFEERRISFSRQYEAMGVNSRVDMVARIWRAPARIGMYVVITDYEDQENPEGDQYRIENVQHTLNSDGLKVTDLTLYRLEDFYAVSSE
ncbi:MAG: hypothetical protein IJR31_08625 [Lachnospiraceae bacterium]|nr:hypothetical protein [Lachnospiraceae bacterium]